MPKIVSRQPDWLSRTSPAFRLFNGVKSPRSHKEQEASEERLEARGLRTLAHRGSEVFVADGNTVRWADLASMKANWESQHDHYQTFEEDEDPLVGAQYRLLQFKYVVEPIVQLSISPNNSLLAVVTAHTVHICIIPDPKHLSEPDNGPVRCIIQMVGNTTHVLSAAQIVSVLWHPFGVGGNCLVTVTSDAVVRIWELSMQNRFTAEEPTLATDLRKLRNARSTSDDTQPRRLGISEGISYDALEMMVASACFGGIAAEQESGWAAMTLWIIMTEGDVYALCPLLPTKWQASPTILPNLASSILSAREQKKPGSKESKFSAQHQWFSEQESVPAIEVTRKSEFQRETWIYTRPKEISAIPKLQGPFSIVPGDLQLELSLADILVIAPRLKDNDNDTEDMDGLPVSLICLLTQSGTVYTCADLNGVHGQWLPDQHSKIRKTKKMPKLIVLGAVDTLKQPNADFADEMDWPTFSADSAAQHAFYVTNSEGIWYLSVENWIESLQSEMSAETNAGTEFRLHVGAEGSKIQRQKLICFLEREEDQPSAPLVVNDSDLGHMVLTMCEATPQVVILDSPRIASDVTTNGEQKIKQEHESELVLDAPIEMLARAAYTPSKIFCQDLGSLKDRLRRLPSTNTELSQAIMNDHVRLSPAILEIMTHDHRVLSKETHKIGLVVADLFTRCKMMQLEFKTQLQCVREIAQRVDNLSTSQHSDDSDNPSQNSEVTGKLDHRLHAAEMRQIKLLKRLETLKKRTGAVGRPLSDRERNWIGQVNRLAREIPLDMDEKDRSCNSDESETVAEKIPQPKQDGKYLRRYDEVENLVKKICSQADSLSEEKVSPTKNKEDPQPASPSNSIAGFSTSRGLRVPPDIRKQKMIGLENSMERQTALLDATIQRLESLGIEL